MKKFRKILFLSSVVLVASCQKEVITPNDEQELTRPTWSSTDIPGDEDITRGGKDSQDKSVVIIGTGEGDLGNGGKGEGGGAITDPNKDPDANKQKGGRR
ncbi:MAG: hypothetical protein EP338_05660 [Bacteroidetes bacterium]|nr:MAG: hypothetical protein EP338_05660 [Bacteroidota bacterium]